MGQEEIEDLLRESGRGMSLEELARATGLAKTTVLRNVNKLWRDHRVSRMYKFNDENVRYVYYSFGGRAQDDDKGMKKVWQSEATILKISSDKR
jgi:DNA-binding MarR family transcriptional regulator